MPVVVKLESLQVKQHYLCAYTWEKTGKQAFRHAERALLLSWVIKFGQKRHAIG
jgi:hypothetical protein